MRADFLIADTGFGRGGVGSVARQGMDPVIPPRKNRNNLRDYDPHLDKIRHWVENAFLRLKE